MSSGVHRPQTNGAIRAPACECVAIGTERYAISCEAADVLSGVHIPQIDDVCIRKKVVVLTSTCECSTIGTEHYTLDPIRMTSDQVEFCSCLRIVKPNADGTRNRKPSAIWRICYLIYLSFTQAGFRTFG